MVGPLVMVPDQDPVDPCGGALILTTAGNFLCPHDHDAEPHSESGGGHVFAAKVLETGLWRRLKSSGNHFPVNLIRCGIPVHTGDSRLDVARS